MCVNEAWHEAPGVVLHNKPCFSRILHWANGQDPPLTDDDAVPWLLNDIALDQRHCLFHQPLKLDI